MLGRSKLALGAWLSLAGAAGVMMASVPAAHAAAPARGEQKPGLPRLLDLGADRCIPCKMMQPVLSELRQEQSGKLLVEFIDIGKNPEQGPRYHVVGIPTQLFFDRNGKEVFRHLGFYSKASILTKFRELGLR